MGYSKSEEKECNHKYLIHARPNSKFDKVEFKDDEIVVYTRSPPDKGKANKSIIKLLAKHFNVKTAKIQIIRGHTSSSKLIEIDLC